MDKSGLVGILVSLVVLVESFDVPSLTADVRVGLHDLDDHLLEVGIALKMATVNEHEVLPSDFLGQFLDSWPCQVGSCPNGSKM